MKKEALIRFIQKNWDNCMTPGNWDDVGIYYAKEIASHFPESFTAEEGYAVFQRLYERIMRNHTRYECMPPVSDEYFFPFVVAVASFFEVEYLSNK